MVAGGKQGFFDSVEGINSVVIDVDFVVFRKQSLTVVQEQGHDIPEARFLGVVFKDFVFTQFQHLLRNHSVDIL